ncbi:MAG: hypothetical protein A2W11_04165 [Ignavibacteria bacterium RBG_16_35_7]|nr:MAG: hypothetical protein A2W11_04165 [Ignavibacteria bacterium RBG_16_35_7]
MGTDLINLENPDLLRILIEAFSTNNVVQTLDYVPSSNLGYLAVSLVDVSWLKVNPLFAIITPSGNSAEFIITIDPSGINPGYHSSGITVYSSHAGEMERMFIPINLDYVTGIAGEQSDVPDEYQLYQNYPNPFNPSTTIKYDLKEKSFVELKLYDILGREIDVLVNKEQSAGRYELEFDASNLASGIYFYRIQAGEYVSVKKMLLMK